MLREPWWWGMAVLLWVATPAMAQVPSLEGPFHLSSGTQKVITLPPEVRAFSVRDEGMMEVRPIGNRQLLLVGLGEGVTELAFYGAHGPVRRLAFRLEIRDACVPICEACRFFPKGNALKVEGAGDRLVVRGIAHSLEEARGVKLLASEFPVFVDVKVTERAVRQGLMRVNRELWRAGFLDARAVVVGARVVLSGRFASDAQESLARATIAPYAAWLEERLGLPVLPSAPASGGQPSQPVIAATRVL